MTDEMSLLLAEVFGVDVYGGMYDTYCFNSKLHAKINWNG
jgi:hypothetical protein